MSDTGHRNLSGYWSGQYSYAHGAMATAFNIYIDDQAGVLTGTTLEPNTFADPAIEELSATIAGERAGSSVGFRKLYDPVSGAHQVPIFYEGEANAEFTVVEGEWLYGPARHPRGGFRMTRASGGAVEEALEVGVSAKADG